MLNMSNFLEKRRIVFDGDNIPVVIEPQLRGEISIEEVNQNLIEKIIKEVFEVEDKEKLENELYFIYKVFPYLLKDVEMDINFEEFIELVEYPRNHFEIVLEMVQNEVNDIIQKGKNLVRIQEKSEKMQTENKELFESVEKEKSLNELNKVATNKPKRKYNRKK